MNLSLGRVAIGLGIIEAQTMSGAGPQVAALVFIEIANGNAGQALFEAVLNPVPVIEPVYSAIRRHPDAAITMTAQERIDTIKSAAHFRPVVAVELPDSVGGGAPDFAICRIRTPRR